MKNDSRKPTPVILLDPNGTPEPGEREVIHAGKLGFRVKGSARVLWWADKGKTWRQAEK